MIVCADGLRDTLLRLSEAGEPLLEQFLFENAVDPFGDGIFQRVALFRHADAYLAKQTDVGRARVLRTAIRVVDQRRACRDHSLVPSSVPPDILWC